MNNPRAQTLKEQFSKPSAAWEICDHEFAFRFWVQDGPDEKCWALPFFSLIGACYDKKDDTLSLGFPVGSIVVTGPKAFEFYTDFCKQRGTLLRVDAKDILSVTFAQNGQPVQPIAQGNVDGNRD